VAVLHDLRRLVTSRLPRGRAGRRLAVVAAALVLTGAGGAVAGAAINGRSGHDDELVGDPVPTTQVTVIARAALSCPQLNTARLAGQLMAASRFREDATTPEGGSGVAGLTDAQWQTWVPWLGAQRHDPAAEITALAHLMCDLGGQLRNDDLGVDLWQPMLAAHRSGVDAVRATHGIPDEARDYVRVVVGYADWYTNHSALAMPSETASSAASSALGATAQPKPLPANLVPLVVAAGRQCPQVTGARIAAQLMAASAFRADLLGSDGGQGIAQFLPAVWNRYADSGRSPWQPKDAVPTLATAMCSLTTALGGITADPYPAALTAFRGGPVTAAPAPPDGFADQVLAFATYYAKDPRLAGAAAAPRVSQPVVSLAAGAPPSGAAAAPGAPRPAVTTTRATTTAATAATTAAGPAEYQIKGYAGKCIDATSSKDGAPLQISTCTGGADQKFTFGNRTVKHDGLCVDLAWAGSDNGTPVQLATCNGGWAQRFWINDAHDLVNAAIGKCVDVVDKNTANGTRLQLWDCTGASNQKWSRQ
jgi:hypothetical protein